MQREYSLGTLPNYALDYVGRPARLHRHEKWITLTGSHRSVSVPFNENGGDFRKRIAEKVGRLDGKAADKRRRVERAAKTREAREAAAWAVASGKIKTACDAYEQRQKEIAAMSYINDLRAAAHAADEREEKARDAYQAAKDARARIYATYNVEAAREAGIEIGKTVIEAARYSWDHDHGKLRPCVAVQPSQHALDCLVVRDVTNDGKPWPRRRPYTVRLNKVRVTDRTVPEA